MVIKLYESSKVKDEFIHVLRDYDIKVEFIHENSHLIEYSLKIEDEIAHLVYDKDEDLLELESEPNSILRELVNSVANEFGIDLENEDMHFADNLK